LHEAQLNPEEGLQLPQAESVLRAFEANVENSFAVLIEPHFGHLAIFTDEEISSSNFWLHSKQLNS